MLSLRPIFSWGRGHPARNVRETAAQSAGRMPALPAAAGGTPRRKRPADWSILRAASLTPPQGTTDYGILIRVLRRNNILRSAKASAAAILLCLLPVALAVCAQIPGAGSPNRPLTDQDPRAAFARAQQALAAQDYSTAEQGNNLGLAPAKAKWKSWLNRFIP